MKGRKLTYQKVVVLKLFPNKAAICHWMEIEHGRSQHANNVKNSPGFIIGNSVTRILLVIKHSVHYCLTLWHISAGRR